MKNKKSIMLWPYIIIIIVCDAAIIIVNIFAAMPIFDIPLWQNIIMPVGGMLALIAIDGLCASLSHSQVKKMKPFSKYFTVSKREKNFLRILGVRKFKDYLPDLGVLVNFKKGSISNPNSKEYIYTYLQESCCGELGHLAGAVLGFLVIFLIPLKFCLYYALPMAIVNFILSILPVISLRFNRPALTTIYRGLERREKFKSDIPAEKLSQSENGGEI